MLRVVWTSSAVDDLAVVIDYIAERHYPAAERMQALIEDATERLPNHPFAHRPGRIHGTREAVVHPNYIVVYSVGLEVITILAVVHARQQYP